MIRVSIESAWRFTRAADADSVLLMLDFLHDIRATGNIAQAAARARVSYRHAWNLVDKWSGFFGLPLVERLPGGTRLTPFGETIEFAGQRLETRLGAELRSLARELESGINDAPGVADAVLRIHAGSGLAVSCLQQLAYQQERLRLDVHSAGSADALLSLISGSCDLASLHLPMGRLRRRAATLNAMPLSAEAHCLVGFVTREMGLMVAPGNPMAIRAVGDLARRRIRLANREQGSGTRSLFDLLLKDALIDGTRLAGYDHEDFTHTAVAAYVATGAADVAFGAEAAARRFGLDFVPLLTEECFLACQRATLRTPLAQRLLAVLRGEAFSRALSALPGYRAARAGVLIDVNDALRGEAAVASRRAQELSVTGSSLA